MASEFLLGRDRNLQIDNVILPLFDHSLDKYTKSYIFQMQRTIRTYGHTNHQ